MATSLLAFNTVLVGGQQPRRIRRQSEIQKNRATRSALLRMASAPILLALLAGGVILSQNAQVSREVPASTGSAQASRAALPTLVSLRPAVQVARSYDDDDDAAQAAITWARRLPETALSPSVAAFAPDANPAIMQFGPMRIKRELVETVVRAARNTDTDPALLMSIADKESAFAPTVKASTSSATGLFQFIDSTWLRVVRDFGSRPALARRPPPSTVPMGPPASPIPPRGGGFWACATTPISPPFSPPKCSSMTRPASPHRSGAS